MINTAKIIAKRTIEEKIHLGKNPSTIAAASLYLAGLVEGERRSQREVSKTTGVSVASLVQRFREILLKVFGEVTLYRSLKDERTVIDEALERLRETLKAKNSTF